MTTPLELKIGEPVAVTPAVFLNGAVVAHTRSNESRVQRITLTLTNVVVTVVSGATSIGGTAVARLPDKNFVVLNSEVDLVVTKGGDFVTADDIVFSVGSVTAASEALDGADANILGAQDKDAQASGFSIEASRITSNTASYSPGAIIDSATNDIYLNAACDDDGLAADGTLTFNGTVDIWLAEVGNVTS
jgi:hypothetical protein